MAISVRLLVNRRPMMIEDLLFVRVFYFRCADVNLYGLLPDLFPVIKCLDLFRVSLSILPALSSVSACVTTWRGYCIPGSSSAH